MIDKQMIASWKILIIDDEPDSLEVATRVLTFHGAQVYNAANGKEGLAKVEEVHPTFILSDLSMPVMDGWEMLYHLQSNPRTKDIPVIALTAHAMSGDRERAVAAGFHYYLTKPLSPMTFLTDLLRLFTEHPPMIPLTTPAAAAPPTPQPNGNSGGNGSSGSAHRPPTPPVSVMAAPGGNGYHTESPAKEESNHG